MWNKNSFFDINSVAVIWASENTEKIWNSILKNLSDFSWEKFWVNPKWWEFEWIKFYESIERLPKIVDIAIIVIPAKFVINSLIEIAKKGIKRVIIISAGFKEIGNIEEENEMKNIAKKYNIQILWPNCLGYIDTYKKLNLSFWSKNVRKWNVAMISQSWAMAVAFTDWANMHEVWFSKIISMWNKCDVTENELLEELENDENTKVIAIYVESIEFGKRFFELAKRITKTKPIILVKSWMSNKWIQAASSHTWALSWEAEIFKTAFKQAWIHYTSKLENFLLWSKIFANSSAFLSLWLKGKMPERQIGIFQNVSDELIIITNAWGPWVMVTDHCEYLWVKMAEFNNEEKEKLMKWLPKSASVSNPIDIIWDATSERYSQILENIKSLEKKRAILLMLTPQTVTDTDKIAETIVEFKKNNPDFYVMASFMWDASLWKSREILNDKDVLDFNYPQKAILAFSKILKQKKWENKQEFEKIIYNTISIENILNIKKIILEEKKLISSIWLWKIMNNLDLPFVKNYLVKSEKESEKIYEKIGAKKLLARISSEDIPHKTDVWGVVLNILNPEQAKDAYNKILKNVSKNVPEAKIEWVIYSVLIEQTNDLREIFVWLKRDKTFWNVLILWMWWIYVNVYEDVSRRILPISKTEIKEMFSELKWFPILNWYRWAKSVDFDKISDIIYTFTELFDKVEEIKEIDINPLFATSDENNLVDVKMYL